MKKIIKKRVIPAGMVITLLLFAGVNQAQGQFWRSVSGSGDIVSEMRDLKGFDKIEAGGAVNLNISFGDQWHVEVEADDNVIEYIDTRVREQTLEIETTRTIRRSKVDVHVTLPELRKLNASGAVNVSFNDPVEQNFISVKASGASNIKLTVNVEALEVHASAASDITVEGTAYYAEVTASGASNIRGAGFECVEADVRLSGASDMRAAITDKVTGSLSGASDLRIAGDPVVEVSTSGASNVRTAKKR